MAVSGRIYTSPFVGSTLSAVQDLFNISPGATRVIALLSITLGQVTATSIANQKLRIRRIGVTAVVGSGGATIPSNPYVAGDAAATATVRSGDTTQASTAGVYYDMWADQWNLLNGFLWVPQNVNRPLLIKPSEMLVLSLDSAPASVVASGSITWEELP